MSVAREPLSSPAGDRLTAVDSGLIRLELPADSCCHAVGRLVVAGYAARLALPVEQIEDLQLAVEALLSRRTARPTVTLELNESWPGLEARLGPFVPARAERERVQEMLRTLVEDADVQDSGDGEWIVLQVTRSRQTTRGRA